MSKLKILVVDDEPDIVEFIKVRLESQGYEIIGASDGDEALKKMTTEMPDLIILDIVMPKKDGFTFVLEKNKLIHAAEIPVIILSSKDQMEDLFQLEGVNDYLVKPYDGDKLITKIENLIG